jgi:beta-phosphoglucomutase
MGDAEARDFEGECSLPGVSFLEQHGFGTVLWDWDGVLVDSAYNFYHAYEMVLREEGIITNPREIYLREGEPTPRLLRAIFDHHNVPVDNSKIRELVARRRDYDASLGPRRLFPAVHRLLRQLTQAGCRMGMVTGSSQQSLERVLTPEQAGWFDVIITADDVACGKPAPDPFLNAIRALKAEPEQCVVVENAPFGIRAARAAGCAVVAICTTLTATDLHQANWIVGDHEELQVLLLGDGPQYTDKRMSRISGETR